MLLLGGSPGRDPLGEGRKRGQAERTEKVKLKKSIGGPTDLHPGLPKESKGYRIQYTGKQYRIENADG